MADDADRAEERLAPLMENRVGEIRRKAAAIPLGEPGACDLCGEIMPRLVNGICCPCRDRRGLP